MEDSYAELNLAPKREIKKKINTGMADEAGIDRI